MTLEEIGIMQWSISEDNNWHNKTPLEFLALIGSEVGEACQECRGDTPTKKLGEELADIILRTCDFAIQSGVDLEREVSHKFLINKTSGARGRRK